MKAGWKTLIVVGVALVALSGQVMAQPWDGGPGWGQGRFQGQGMRGPGAMAQQWGPQAGRGMGRGQGQFQGQGMRGRGPMTQQWGPQAGRGMGRGQGQFQRQGMRGPGAMAQQWGPQAGRGDGRMPRAGQGGAGAWCPFGTDGGMMRDLLARRLNLTPDQRERIRDIAEQARSRVQAAIKDVLTEEQLRQFQQMRGRAGQFNQPMQGPGAGTPDGRMGPRGQGMRGQGMEGRVGPRGQGWGGPGMQDGRPQMGPGRQQPPAPQFQGRPGAGGRGQGMGPARQDGVAPLDRPFDRADANDDGVLTPEEFKTFQDTMRRGRQSEQR